MVCHRLGAAHARFADAGEQPAGSRHSVAAMTQSTKKLLATVAFAALASTALPSFAQEAPATIDQTAPSPASEVPPAVQQTQAAPPIVLPQITTAATTLAAPVPIPAQTILKVPTIDAPAPRAAAPVKPATAARKPVVALDQRSASVSDTAPAAPAVASIDPVTPATTAALPSAAVPATVTTTVDTSAPADDIDWALIGGIAAAGLALGVGGLALTRRRRPDEDVGALPAVSSATPLFAGAGAELAPPARPVSVPARSFVEPNGAGHHVAAAARGPTAENPFLTERARIRRARFLDKREAIEGVSAPSAAAEQQSAGANRESARPAQTQTTYSLAKTKPQRFGFRLRPANG